MTTQESREQEIKRLNAEKVKQIALCHFYSYYVRHNMSDMLAYVGEDVTWLGSQSDLWHTTVRSLKTFWREK